jgi:Family of unknown function (DUF5522)
MSALRQKNCSSCGAIFGCGAGTDHCWCADVPPVNITSGVDCFCPKCLKEVIDNQNRAEIAVAPAGAGAELIEGRDYYMEGQAFVFTALYHLRRGYCCESGCRHCPYLEKSTLR